MTFISPSVGFVIGTDSSCAAPACVALARTADRGASWVSLPAPSAGYVDRESSPNASGATVSEVRFANELDGWVYGPSLFATHDGGASWHAVHLGGSVLSLETSAGYVDAVVSPCGDECAGPLKLEQAPVAGGRFSVVLTGPSGASVAGDGSFLSLHGPVGFVNLGGLSRVHFYATGNLAVPGGWKPFPNPCAVSPLHDVNAFVAPNSTTLYTLCSDGAAAGSMPKKVIRTKNGRSRVIGTPPAAGDAGAIAATGTGTLVVSAASGASFLYVSTDDGSSWMAHGYADGGMGFNDLGFTTATQGVVVHGQPGVRSGSHLLLTTDDGRTWRTVQIR